MFTLLTALLLVPPVAHCAAFQLDEGKSESEKAKP